MGVSPTVLFYFPEGVEPTDSPPQAGWWEWAHGLGAADAGFTHVLLTLQASQDLPVEVDVPEVHHEVVNDPSGVLCGPEGVGGNGLDARRFTVLLDAPDPIVPTYGGSDR